MDAAERIADYLSDDLTPDERAAFEAELDRDAALRAQLDAARRAETALAELLPTTLPDGFTDRLRTAIDTELADLLAPGTDEAPDPRVAAEAALGHHDDLAARRARRTAPRWTGVLGTAAAAVLVVVAGVAGLSTLGAGDDAGESAADMDRPESAELEQETTTEGPAGDDGAVAGGTDEAVDAETQMAPEEDAAEDAGDDAAETEGGEAAAGEGAAAEFDTGAGEAPLILAAERRLDDGDLDAILIGPELQQVASWQLEAEPGRQLAADWREALLATGDGEAVREDRFRAHERGAVTGADRAAVSSCVAAAHDPRPEAIPAYAELAEYDGQAAVILGLVVPEPNTGDYSRTEVLALDRDTCRVRTARP